MDGGETWKYVSNINLDAKRSECGDDNEWIIFGVGDVAPDGTVYLVYRFGTKLALAVSKDEALTWETRLVTDARLAPFNTRNLLEIVENPNLTMGEQMTVDDQGNIYVTWIDPDESLRYAYSKDQGKTWSAHVAAL